jgi:hypothetical protein
MASPTCPRCWDRDVRRSQPRPLDYLPFLLLLRPYRCRVCGQRLWRPLWAGWEMARQPPR